MGDKIGGGWRDGELLPILGRDRLGNIKRRARQGRGAETEEEQQQQQQQQGGQVELPFIQCARPTLTDEEERIHACHDVHVGLP
jgi:hypothetical protein